MFSQNFADAPDRGRGAINTEDVDEDDMPPLDGNPSLTYTFHPGMTPLSFASHSAPTATQDVSPHPSKPLISSPPPSPLTPSDDSSMPAIQARPHGKRRDPSYIPRPPNAFILFRSAFIRDQHIPGKVEGNHSKLSKIIGMYWKKLTPAEKEKWEAQALVAQEEHRARYPDWRFRPGANAMAKLKVGEGSTTASRRRSVRSRAKGSSTEDDQSTEMVTSDVKGKGKDKGRAREKGNRMASIEEKRCAKIAGFVAEGLKGEELEVAVTQWESDRHITRPESRPKKVKAVKSRLASTKTHVRSDSDASLLPSPASPDRPPDEASEGSTPTHTQITRTPTLDSRRLSPSSSHVNLTVPLTHLFRRSLSAPVADQQSSHSHSSSERSEGSSTDNSSPASTQPSPGAWGKPLVLQGAPTRTHSHPNRRDNLPFSIPSSSSSTATYDAQHLTWQEAENRRRIEEMQTPDSWWPQRSSAGDSHSRFTFDTPKESVRQVSAAFSTENMGYEAGQQASQYDRGYLEQYRSFDPARDGSQSVEWTNLSTTVSGRQGLVSIVKDPYEDDCDADQQPLSQPPTLSIPPPTDNSYYFQPVSPASPSAVPSSTFSTLHGWDGDSFKQPPTPITTSARAWPDLSSSRSSPMPSPSISSSAWYNSSGMYAWGDHRPQLQHAPLSLDSQEWDRQEYRASSQMHLRTDPPRQLDFQEELRRMNRS